MNGLVVFAYHDDMAVVEFMLCLGREGGLYFPPFASGCCHSCL